MITMVTASAAPVRIREIWTHADVDALPDDGMRHELLDGVLIVSPPPVPVHQRAVLRISRILEDACPPESEVFVAPLDWRPDALTSLEPDVLLVPQSALTEANVRGIPTLVVEVFSPSTARIDRTAKMSRYFDGGIAQYWLVDPGSSTGRRRPPSVEVYERAERAYHLQGRAEGDEEVTAQGVVTVALRPSELVRPR